MTDREEKSNLPVHIILETSEYARIKTPNKPRMGRPGEPIAELTKFGWTILSPGKEVDLNNMFLTQVRGADYNALCSLDVLGLRDTQPEVDVYEDLKKQPEVTKAGMKLGCRGNKPTPSYQKTRKEV